MAGRFGLDPLPLPAVASWGCTDAMFGQIGAMATQYRRNPFLLPALWNPFGKRVARVSAIAPHRKAEATSETTPGYCQERKNPTWPTSRPDAARQASDKQGPGLRIPWVPDAVNDDPGGVPVGNPAPFRANPPTPNDWLDKALEGHFEAKPRQFCAMWRNRAQFRRNGGSRCKIGLVWCKPTPGGMRRTAI